MKSFVIAMLVLSSWVAFQYFYRPAWPPRDDCFLGMIEKIESDPEGGNTHLTVRYDFTKRAHFNVDPHTVKAFHWHKHSLVYVTVYWTGGQGYNI